MPSTKFFPSLNSLVTSNIVPGSIGRVFKKTLDTFASNIYYKGYTSSSNSNSSRKFHSLTLIIYKRIAIDLLGEDGFSIAFNPDHVDGTTSEIPVSLDFEWPILKYSDIVPDLESINVTNFDDLTEVIDIIFNLLIDISGADEDEFLEQSIAVLYESSEDSIGNFITDFNNNTVYTNLTTPITSLPYEELVIQIEQQGLDVFEVILTDFIAQNEDISTVFSNIQDVFEKWLSDFDFVDVLNLLVPKLRASINTPAVAVLFPRYLFQPIDPATQEIYMEESIRAQLRFEIDKLIYNSESGFEFGTTNNISFDKSVILNTGFTIELTNAEIDLSSESSIQQVFDDGRTEEFKGIYVQTATIGLPPTFTPSAGNASIVGTDLIIGNPGGISGTIALDLGDPAEPLSATIAGVTFDFYQIDVTFHQNSVTNFAMNGNLFLPGFKARSAGNDYRNQPYFEGEDAPIGVDITFNDLDGTYTVASNSIPEFKIGNIEIDLESFSFTFGEGGIQDFSINGTLAIPSMNAPADDPIGIQVKYENISGIDKWSILATNFPTMDLGGLQAELITLGFEFTDGSVSAFGSTGRLFFPGLLLEGDPDTTYTDAYGATYPIGSDGIGPEAPIAFGLSYTNAGVNPTLNPEIFALAIGVSAIPPVSLGGIELSFPTDFSLSIVNGTLDTINVAALLTFPAQSADEIDQTLGVQLTKISSENFFKVEATFSGIEFDIIKGITFIPENILITFDNTGILYGSMQSLLEIDRVKDDTDTIKQIEVDLALANNDYQLKLRSPQSVIGLKLGKTELEVDYVFVRFDGNNITEFAIDGELIMGTAPDTKRIGYGMAIMDGGFAIMASNSAGVELDIGIAKITLYKLTIGRNGEGKWWVQVGPLTDANGKVFGAFIEKQLEIPLVDKFLPDNVDAKELKFVQGSGLDTANANVTMAWPELEGFEISSDKGNLEAIIPVNKTLFKTITIDNVIVAFSNTGDAQGTTNVNIGIDGSLELGPVTGTVQGLGLQAQLTFPTDGNGNLGPLDIDPASIGFYGPSGIGISIDSKGVKGGGFLSFNKDKGEYSGFVGLTINKKISLNAIGILNTKFPDGSKGVSLLVILTAEFNPGIQLGFGFKLSGLGGLLGLNRTMEIEPLRQGIKNNTIDSILFPDSSAFLSNAPAIISNIGTIFPVDKGRFVFGPMALIGWGTPTLITAELGVLIEVPKPVRLALLGVIKSILPDEDNDLLRLQINFLGVIDFAKKQISFDASLFDSKLLSFTLSGDMAFRLNYGEQPAFLLSVGGFHPSFTPSIPVPSMQRLTIGLVNKEKFKITILNYFAVTSNTVQFGSRVELYAKIGVFIGEGHLGFDTLFQFSPFYMTVTISAGLSISTAGKVIAGVNLEGTLEGPTPWKLNGKASFTFLGATKTFSLEKEFGKNNNVTYPTIDNLLDLYVEALEKDNNWEVTTDFNADQQVVIRSVDESERVINGSGVLSINQKIVPLNTSVEKFGNRVPTGGAKVFDIIEVMIGGVPLTGNDITETKDFFAPAEFKKQNNSKKLSSPSFERMKSGVSVTPQNGGFKYGSYVSQKELGYEDVIIDTDGGTGETEKRYQKGDPKIGISLDELRFQTRASAAARSRISPTKNKIIGSNDKRVNIPEEKFAVVNNASLSEQYGFTRGTKAEAEAFVKQLAATNPVAARELEIVGEFSL